MFEWLNRNSGAVSAIVAVVGLLATVTGLLFGDAIISRFSATPILDGAERTEVQVPIVSPVPEAPVVTQAPPAWASPQNSPTAAPPPVSEERQMAAIDRAPAPLPKVEDSREKPPVKCDPAQASAAPRAEGPTTVALGSFGSEDLTSVAESVISKSDVLQLVSDDADACAQDVLIAGRSRASVSNDNQQSEIAALKAYGYGDQIADAPAFVQIVSATAKVEAKFLRKGTRLVEERTVQDRLEAGESSAQAQADVKARATREAVEAIVRRIADGQ